MIPPLLYNSGVKLPAGLVWSDWIRKIGKPLLLGSPESLGMPRVFAGCLPSILRGGDLD